MTEIEKNSNENLNQSSKTQTKFQLKRKQTKVETQKENKCLGLFFCVWQALSAWSMVLLNKTLLTYWHFDNLFIFLFIEYVFIFLISVCWKPIIPRLVGDEIDLFNLNQLKQALPLTFFIIVGLFLALMALGDIPVAIYTVIKRTAPLIVLIIDLIIYKKVPSYVSIFAIILMLFGGVWTCFNLNNINWFGCGMLVLALVFQSLQQIYTEYMGKGKGSDKMNAFALMYYSAVIIAPIFLIINLVSGNFKYLTTFENRYEKGFYLTFMAQLFMATQLILAQMFCSMKNSALTTVVVSNFKDIALTLIGLLLYTDVKVNLFVIIGISISIFGALVFAFDKIRAVGPKQKKMNEEIDKVLREKANTFEEGEGEKKLDEEVLVKNNYTEMKRRLLKTNTLVFYDPENKE